MITIHKLGLKAVAVAAFCSYSLCASAQDVKATLPAAVKASKTKVNDVLKPQAPLNLLKR